MKCGVIASALLILPAFLNPQKFTTSVDAVRVDVFVTEKDRPVAGLVTEDFELMDNGVVQKVDAIGVADVPVSLMVVLDTSRSVAGATLDRLRQAASDAVATLEPGDRAAILTFSDEVRRLAAWTEEIASVHGALQTVSARGATALFDAAFAGLTLRDTAPGRRHLILLFSDGADTASWLPESAVVAKAERTDAVIYSVVLGGVQLRPPTLMYRSGIRLSDTAERSGPPGSFPQALADASGGQMFTARSTRDLQESFRRIVNEFRSRYLLTYMPRGVETSGWHQISVKLRNRPGTVIARRGYYR
jgi:Ca-activated chloride channel homolog